ncbi:hypothetical protein VNI00_007424 [Paramarasmius palmivorus]|uniref:Inhibitor I9 domain-containing protein n=1 Tax=Paramarasmius palmivorus TaxID=297713 RepID=A0AAW0D3M6_9AGAR
MSDDLTSYIVLFEDFVTDEEIERIISEINASGGKVTHRYTIIRAIAARIPDDYVEYLESLPGVTIEEDQEVTIDPPN